MTITETRMLETWLERLSAPTITESHIRQFCHNIAPAWVGDFRGGRHSSLTDDQCVQLCNFLIGRVRHGDGGPLVSEDQAQRGRDWLYREWAHLELPGERSDTQLIVDFLFEGAHQATVSRYRNVFAPIYLARWQDGRRLLYTAVPWQAKAWDPGLGYTRLLKWVEM